jgi:hypothetical protein
MHFEPHNATGWDTWHFSWSLYLVFDNQLNNPLRLDLGEAALSNDPKNGGEDLTPQELPIYWP